STIHPTPPTTLFPYTTLFRSGQLTDPNVLYAPPGLTTAQLAALRYDPDLVLTKVPQATRRFGQLQLRLDARYRTWWAGASATIRSEEHTSELQSRSDLVCRLL